jgi:cyclic pyranopterin phosphate synthase
MSDILIDRFGRRHTYLRISVTERCNLRCHYCMPAEGVELSPRSHILTFEEIDRLARLFVKRGVTTIRLTGGEPLVRKDVEELVGILRSIPGLEELKMTTNGILLDRKLEALRESGLTGLNISLDTLRPKRFLDITRRPGLDKVLHSIDLAIGAGYVPTRINCVVMKGVNDDEIVEFVQMTRSRPVTVRFIEYMPFSGNGWSDGFFTPWREVHQLIEHELGPLQRLSETPNSTSREFRVPGFEGTVGFISSMSDHFCDSCNRLRITADGNLKVCLFGQSEVSLRDMIRAGSSDAELEEVIADAVQRKKAQHAGMYNLVGEDNRPMILIGG